MDDVLHDFGGKTNKIRGQNEEHCWNSPNHNCHYQADNWQLICINKISDITEFVHFCCYFKP